MYTQPLEGIHSREVNEDDAIKLLEGTSNFIKEMESSTSLIGEGQMDLLTGEVVWSDDYELNWEEDGDGILTMIETYKNDSGELVTRTTTSQIVFENGNRFGIPLGVTYEQPNLKIEMSYDWEKQEAKLNTTGWTSLIYPSRGPRLLAEWSDPSITKGEDTPDWFRGEVTSFNNSKNVASTLTESLVFDIKDDTSPKFKRGERTCGSIKADRNSIGRIEHS